MPALSILVLCWNQERYLEQCIASLAAQTRRDFEVVFLDNASTDSSFEAAERLFDAHGIDARPLRNERPEGISRNFNRLVAESAGELVAPLAADDWLSPRYVEAMIDAAGGNPDAGWFYPNGWFYWDEEDRLEEIDSSGFATGDLSAPLLRGEIPLMFVGCCYRRSAIEGVGGWDESQLVEDRDMFLRLSLQFPVHFVDERLAYYRRSKSAASADPEFMVRGWERFYPKHRALLGRTYKAQFAEMYRRHAAVAVDHGRLGLAARLLVKSITQRPYGIPLGRTILHFLRRAASLRRI
jgi:glycosyltransferase involved in cell wall biosynthesis